MPSRRRVLATATAGVSLAAAGCLDRFSSSQRLVGVTTEEPIFSDGTRSDGAQFQADVFATPNEAEEALNTTALPSNGYPESFIGFNPDEELLAVCASTLAFTPEGHVKGWCPRRQIDGEAFVFRFPVKSVPNELEDPDVNRAIFNVWSRALASPPTQARAELVFLDENDDSRVCTD